jgi:small subunit ribosomal protein S6
MKKYEITFIVSENFTEDRAADIAKDVKKLIETHGGKVEKEVFWGKRKLIYKIAKNSFGYYYVFIFNIDVEKTNKLNKELNLNEKILRYLIVDFIEGSPFFEEGAREKEKERGRRDAEEMIEKRPARKVFKKKEFEDTPAEEKIETVEEQKPVEIVEEKVEEKPVEEKIKKEKEVIEEKTEPVKEEIVEEKPEEKIEKEDGMEERKPERRQMTEVERKEQLEKKLAELLKDEEV